MSDINYLAKLEILEKRLKTIKAVLKEAYSSKDRKKTNKEKDEPDVSVERPDATTPQSDLPHYGFSKEEAELEKAKSATRPHKKNPGARRVTPKKVYSKRIQRFRIFPKRVIQANRGITSFWRSDDRDESIEYNERGQWKLDKMGIAGTMARNMLSDMTSKEENKLDKFNPYIADVVGSAAGHLAGRVAGDAAKRFISPEAGNIASKYVGDAAKKFITSKLTPKEKKKKEEVIKYEKNGQWKLDKIAPMLAAAAGSIAGNVISDAITSKEESDLDKASPRVASAVGTAAGYAAGGITSAATRKLGPTGSKIAGKAVNVATKHYVTNKLTSKSEEVKKYGSAVTAAAGGADGVFQAELSEDTACKSEASKYHIFHKDKPTEPITKDPMTLKDIIDKHGSVQQLEGKGHIIKRIKQPKIIYDPGFKKLP